MVFSHTVTKCQQKIILTNQKTYFMEGYISEVRMFAGNFAPGAWNYCDGSLQSIAVYTALFSLIGTTYGGDGQTTFALPDFRGRLPIGTGQGPGLSNYVLGQESGTENVTITTAQMAAHNHAATLSIQIPATTVAGNVPSPGGNILGNLSGAYTSDTPDSAIAPFPATITLQPVGGNVPFSIMQPYLALNYIICMEGIFPSRN
jgi:microcystin-dependent protein